MPIPWPDPLTLLVLVVMALASALTNGAVGYGFSTLFTPVASLFVFNAILNPAVVLVELGANLTLLYQERASIPLTWRRAAPVVLGLSPGVVAGTVALQWLEPNLVRILLFATLLPFTLLQLLGVRRPIRRERRWTPVLGGGIGFLYALTTISGPPLAAFWNNQNLGKNEFRCTMAQVRVAESACTVSSYLVLGLVFPSRALFAPVSLALVPIIAIPVLLGVPAGVFLLRSVPKVRYLRIVAMMDSALISLGLLTAIGRQGLLNLQQQVVLLALAVASLALLAVRVLRNLPAHADWEKMVAARGSSPGRSDRSRRAFVVWIEGLPSSGKSTVARELATSLQVHGWRTQVLDGRETRRMLSTATGRTPAHREERARRLSELARRLAAGGTVAIVPMTSPYESVRRAARSAGGERYVEVWLRCPLKVCQERDSKGLYRRYSAGVLPLMVGVNDPFEEPRTADLIVDTAGTSADSATEQVLTFLTRRGLL